MKIGQMMKIKLEYAPCACRQYDAIRPGHIPHGIVFAENFDSQKAAAFRIKEHIEAGNEQFSVHCQGVHVVAASIDGVRYEEGL